MDKNGIGTDATQAEHIETIKQREYVFVEDRDKLVPGKLGMALAEGYDSMGIAMSKPAMRAGLETDLQKICDGVKTKDEVLREQSEKYRQIFDIAQANVRNLDMAAQHFLEEDPVGDVSDDIPGLNVSTSVTACAACSCMIVLRQTQTGKWMLGCQGYPTCRNTIWFPGFVLDAKVTNSTCQQCPSKPAQLDLVVKRGSLPPFYPSSQLTVCFGGCDAEILELFCVSKLNGGIVSQGIIDTGVSRRGIGAATRGGQNRFDPGPPRGGGGGGSGHRGGGPPRGGGGGPGPRGGGGPGPRGGGGPGPRGGGDPGPRGGGPPRGGRGAAFPNGERGSVGSMGKANSQTGPQALASSRGASARGRGRQEISYLSALF